MTVDLYFYNQSEFRKIPKRYRKLPEELPESLRFAHLNPKVAALLANKERAHKQDKEDPFGDGLGQKSLLPDINSAFQNVRNQFDSALSNDEDSQRYLFEEAKYSAQGILEQLSRIIYFYEDLYKFIPKSLECQILSGYNELTADVTVVPREWQTQEMKEQYAASLQREAASDLEDYDEELSRPRSRMGTDKSVSEFGSRLNIKKTRPRLGVIEASPEEDSFPVPESRAGRKTSSRQSILSQNKLHLDMHASRMGSRVRKGSSVSSQRSIMSGFSPSVHKGRMRDDVFSMIDETPSDLRSTAMAGPLSYMQTINFQLSNKSFEEKGWIMLKGRHEEVDPSAVIEHCVARLQEAMKQAAAFRQKEIELGYDKAVAVRYYGDTRKETVLKFRKSPTKANTTNVHKGGKPRIPSISDEKNEGKKLMQVTHIDGTTLIYYPSGRPAVVHSAAGYGRPGYYTIVYDDGLDSRMVACFTPSGKGVCYHPNGVVRFLATEKGGHLSGDNGAVEKKWKWPQQGVFKNIDPISCQVTPHVMFRCVGRGQMTIVFSCQKEVARFSVSPSPGAEDYKPGEDTEQLLTAFTFSSKTAKDLMRIFAPTKKQKKSKGRKYPSKSQTSEIVKLLHDFPDKVTYELEADKELARLQRKARNLVDDWLEHYRLAIGLSMPSLQSVSERWNYSIATRHAKSAKQSEHGLMIRKAVLGVDDDENVKKSRVPSAPLGLSGEKYEEEDDDLLDVPLDTKRDSMVTFEEPRDAGGDTGMVPSAVAMINRMADTASRRSARSKASSARSVSPSRQSVFTSFSERIPSALSGNRSHCPLVIRQQILGYDKPQCRCSRHHIPFIMDLELDEYVSTEVPEGQLIVIMVVSSLFPGITNAEEMLNEIYQNQNRNRTRPCVQSRSDMFRVFKYDINTAADMSDHTQPLLLTRHSVVPGMFLMYCDGRLLFCDHIFNGYGNNRRDFKKQVMKSRHDAIQCNYLPKDFKFSPSRGRSGLRSAWGGEIGGAGVDKYSSPGTVLDSSLVPIHRPISSSTGNSKDEEIDAVRYGWRRNTVIFAWLSSRRPFLPLIESVKVRGGGQNPGNEFVEHWVSTDVLAPIGSSTPCARDHSVSNIF